MIGKSEKKMGLRSSNTVQLHLEDCRVPKHNLLGERDRGYSIALKNLDGGRIGIAAQACGIAEAALDEGVRYANERTAFGAPIGKLQAIQFMIADSAVADRMLQVHGGYGYVEEYPIERLYRDARVTRIYEGTSEVQRLVIARDVLGV